MNAKQVLTPMLIALAAGLGIYALWQGGRGPEQAPIQGMMEAQETDIAPKLTGRIAELRVQEGQAIAKGELLLRIDSPEVQAKLTQASNAEAAASAVALKAHNGARPQEIRMARANYERAQAGAELAKKSHERVESLHRDGLVATQKRDEAEANWHASERLAEAAKAQWELTQAGARAEDQEAASAQARQVAGLVQEVEAARAETELKAPVAGTVAKLLAKVGELSPAGVPVVTIVDLADQWAVFNVREDQLARFAIGAEFEARVPALPEQPRLRFKVTASKVLPYFATWRATRGNQGYDLRTFEVKARPLQTIQGARPGMSVLLP